jgi:hypothetical protein
MVDAFEKIKSIEKEAPFVKVKDNARSLLLIDSKHRDPSDPINDFGIARDGSSFNMINIRRLAATEINFPWNFRNVSKRNNKFRFSVPDDGHIVHVATLPPGFFDYKSLRLIIEQQFSNNTFEPPFVDPNIPAQFRMLWSDKEFVYDIYSNDLNVMSGLRILKEPFIKTDIWDLAGFSQYYGQDVNMAQPIGTKGVMPKAFYTRYVDIVSPDLNTYNPIVDETSSYSSTNIVARIYPFAGTSQNRWGDIQMDGVTVQGSRHMPHVVNYQIHTPKWMDYAPDRALGLLRFRVLDEFGDKAEFDGTDADFQLTFICEEAGRR